MNNDLKIQIVGTLNAGLTIGEINTAIKGIENKINKIKLKVDIDDKVLAKMNNFAKQMQRISETNLNPNKIVEEITNIDGSKIKRTFMDGYNGAFSEIKKRANESKNEQLKAIDEVAQGYGKLTKQVEKYNAAQQKTGETRTYSDTKGVNTRTINANGNDQVTGFKDTYDKAKELKLAQQEAQKYQQSVESLKNSLKGLYDQGKITELRFNRYSKLINNAQNIQQVEKLTDSLKRQEQVANNKALQKKLISDATTLRNTHSNTVDKVGINELIKELGKIKPSAQNASNGLKQMETQLKTLKNESREVARSSLGLAEAFKTAMVKYPVWMGATSIFIGIPRLVNSAIDVIVDLDTKLTNLQKVMNADTNFDKVMINATASAKEFGQTISSVMDSYAEFARQGYQENELPLLADAALITSNVGEMEAGKAAEYLTSALVQYKLEAKDAMSVIDAWNSLSNNNATTVEKLAQGYSRAASVANTWGMDMHELNAVIGTVTAATKQSGNEVGNFIKNVLPRLTSAPAGDALETLGISLTNDAGELKSALTIYKEVAQEYQKLESDITKSEVLEGLAGKYHISRMNALLENMPLVDKMYQDSVNSVNSARIENERYMDSLQAKINLTKVEFEQLALATGEAFLTESFIAFLSVMGDMAKSATAVTKTVGALPMIFGTLGIAVVLLSSRIKTLGVALTFGTNAVRKKHLEILGLTSTMSRATVATTVFGTALRGLAVATGIGAALFVVGFAIEKVLSKMTEARERTEEFERKNKELTMSFKDNQSTILSLANEYEELDRKMKSGSFDTKDVERYAEVSNELAGLMPTLVIGEDQYGNKILASAEYIKAKTANLEKQLAIQEQIDALQAKEQAKEDYNASSETLGDSKSSLDAELKNVNTKLMDAAKSHGGFGFVDEKEIAVNSLDEVISKIEELENKKANSGLNKYEAVELDILRDSVNNLDMYTLEVESSRMAMASASAGMVMAIANADKAMSSSTKSMIADLSMFVSTSDASSKAIDGTLGSISDKLEKDLNFKGILNDYGSAIDVYKDQLAKGLSPDELEVYKNKAVEAFTKVKNAILDIAKAEGMDEGDINKLSSQLDVTANSAVQLDNALSIISQSTGKTKEELTALLSLAPEAADGMSDLGSSVEQTSSNFDDLTSSISNINGILEEYQDNNRLSTETLLDLVETYPELLGYINNEAALIDQLKIIRDRDVDAARQQIALKLEANEQFYNSNLSALTQYFGQHFSWYDKDLSQFKTLAQAKADVEAELIRRLASSWAMYYNETSKQFTVDNWAVGSAAGMAAVEANRQLSAARATFSNFTMGRISLDFSKIGTSAGKATSSSNKAASSADKAAKSYNNSVYITDKFKTALEELNAELEVQDKIKRKFPSHSKEYRKALEKEIELLEKQKKLIQEQATSLSKQIASGKIQQTGIVDAGATVKTANVSSSGGNYNWNVLGGRLSGTGALFEKYGNQNGVNPALLAAIAMHETGNGTSSAIRNKNNAFGIMTSKGLRAFSSLEESIKYTADLLRRNYLGKGLTTVEAIQKKYAPVGASNDPNGYNKYWVSGVNKFMSQVGSSSSTSTTANTSSASSSSKAVADYYLNNFRVTSKFGSKESFRSSAHKGLDLANGKQGDLVKAVKGGKVITAAYSSSAGNWVVIQQDDGTVAKYMHLQKTPSVKQGQTVTAGQTLGYVGNTGQSTGAHLHFQVESGGKAIDPLTYLKNLQNQVESVSATTTSQATSEATKAVAEGLQAIDQAKSELLSLQTDIVDIEAQIEQIKHDLVMSYVDEYEYLIGLQEKKAKQLRNATYHMSNASDEYIAQLNQERSTYIEMQRLNELEIKRIGELMKVDGITATTLAELQSRLDDAMERRYAIASSRDGIVDETINAQIEKYIEKIKELDTAMERLRITREHLVEGSKEYVASLKEEISLLGDKRLAILREIDQIQESFRKIPMTVEQKQVWLDKIDDLLVEYDQIGSSMSSIRNSIIDDAIDTLKDAYAKELELTLAAEDKKLEAYRKSHDERMKLLDDEMDAYRKAVNDKLRLYADARSEDDFNKNLSKLQKEETELVKKIDILRLDNSQDAIAKRLELEQQLIAKREEIEDLRADREYELLTQSLQDALDAKEEEVENHRELEEKKLSDFEESVEKQKEIHQRNYDEMMDNEQYWLNMRTELMNGNIATMETALQGFLSRFSSYNEETVKGLASTWSSLQSLIKNITDSMSGIGQIPGMNDSIGEGNYGGNTGDVVNDWQTYISNKRKYDKATDPEEKARLNTDNTLLRQKHGFIDGSSTVLDNIDISQIMNKDANFLQMVKDWDTYLSNKKAYDATNDMAKKQQYTAQNETLRKKWNFLDGSHAELSGYKIYGDGVRPADQPRVDDLLAKKQADWNKYIDNKRKYDQSKSDAEKKELNRQNVSLRSTWGFPDGSYDALKKLRVYVDGVYHDGGITGGRGSKLAEFLNNMANGDRIIKSQVGELNIPEKNIPSFISNFANTILSNLKLPNFNASAASPSPAIINFNIENLNGTKQEADTLASRVINKLERHGFRL